MKYLAINIGEKFFGTSHPLTKLTGVSQLVSLIITTAISLASIILLFLLVMGGLQMIAGAGQSNPEKAAKGRQAATAAVIGFVIIFAAYWIIRIIELITGSTFVTNPPLS